MYLTILASLPKIFNVIIVTLLMGTHNKVQK